MSNTAQSLASTRIASLLDENSFVEIGGQVTARSTDFNMAGIWHHIDNRTWTFAAEPAFRGKDFDEKYLKLEYAANISFLLCSDSHRDDNHTGSRHPRLFQKHEG